MQDHEKKAAYHIGFELPLPQGSPTSKTRAAAEAFVQRLGDVSVNRAMGSRIAIFDLTDFFTNLINGDGLDCALELSGALNRARKSGTTHVRMFRDRRTQEVCYEGVDLPTLKDLFPDRIDLS